MEGVGEYHAKRNRPIPKNQRPYDFSDKWIMIHNEKGRQEWRKNELCRGKCWGGCGQGKENKRMRQTPLPYVHV